MTKRTHFIGIGGIGMSGLARLLLARGEEVSGSDLAESEASLCLQKEGACIHYGHDAKHVPEDCQVVYSSAVKKDNPELVQAQSLGCRILHRGDLLAEIAAGVQTIAIAGTHGKTSTSALMAHVLRSAGRDPSYYVGGILLDTDCNAQYGEGDVLVAEVDESDGSFLKVHPMGALLTNVEAEHLDHYQTKDKLFEAFAYFAGAVAESMLVWCGDDPGLQALDLPGTPYGLGEHCAVRALHVRQQGWAMCFDVGIGEVVWKDVSLSLVGLHNVRNALGVIAMLDKLGLSENEIREGLASFGGVKRRCERVGEVEGVLVIDDYGHHPTEVQTTLAGIRRAVPGRRLVAVFQPHRYSRTKECQGLFLKAFDGADLVAVTDIWAAGETPISGINAAMVLREVEVGSDRPVVYAARQELLERLETLTKPGDVLVFFGAGDITKASRQLVAQMRLAVG